MCLFQFTREQSPRTCSDPAHVGDANVLIQPSTLEVETEFMLEDLISGLAICNSLHLGPPQPIALGRKLLGQRPSLHDLSDLEVHGSAVAAQVQRRATLRQLFASLCPHNLCRLACLLVSSMQWR